MAEAEQHQLARVARQSPDAHKPGWAAFLKILRTALPRLGQKRQTKARIEQARA
jgi:hypothetical protein